MNKQIDDYLISCLCRIRTSEKQRAVQFTDKQGRCFFGQSEAVKHFITNFRFPAKELKQSFLGLRCLPFQFTC